MSSTNKGRDIERRITRLDYLSSFFCAAAAGQRLYALDLFARLLIKAGVGEVDVPVQARMRVVLVAGCCVEGIAGWRYSVLVAERVGVDDVLGAVALGEYFKEQTRRVFGALGGFDPRNRLVEDCSRFVSERGGSLKGTATELHEELVSDFKPDRPDELSKFLKDAAEHVPGFVYESETERFKDAEGEWKSRRILTLSEGNRRNGVTA